MCLHRTAQSLLGLGGVLLVCAAQAPSLPSQGTVRPIEQINMSTRDAKADAVLNALRPALYAAGRTARIDYQASCEPVTGRVLFPSISVRPLPPHEPLNLAAFQEMFITDKNVVVSEATSGVVSIRIGRVPEALLHTRIPKLTFYAHTDQYYPQGVFYELKMNGMVRASMKQIGVRPANYISEYLVGERLKGSAHLPSEMRDVTVEQVLDRIARTFNGVVLYGTCATPPVFLLQFIPLVDLPTVTPDNTGTSNPFR
jgi:hypothetical protein